MDHDSPTSVYLFRDAYHVLIYVGVTSRRASRQREHNADKEWWPFVTAQTVEHFPSRPQALAREAELIEKHRPPFNRQRNPSHALVHETYLAFRRHCFSETDPEALVLALDRRIPLVPDGYDETVNELTLRTCLSVGLLAPSLFQQSKVKIIDGPRSVGSLKQIAYSGPLARLVVNIRKDVVVGAQPYADVTIRHGKGGQVRLEVRRIMLSTCEEYDNAQAA